MNVTYDDLDDEVGTHCPQCNAELLLNVAAFMDAINHVIRLECPDCKCDYSLNLTCLTRDAQLRIGADDAGQAPLVTKGELVQMVNSLGNIVIDASSKGYVSGNDQDFANDCLDKVIPLLPGA